MSSFSSSSSEVELAVDSTSSIGGISSSRNTGSHNNHGTTTIHTYHSHYESSQEEQQQKAQPVSNENSPLLAQAADPNKMKRLLLNHTDRILIQVSIYVYSYMRDVRF
jgi:hypothetical protein